MFTTDYVMYALYSYRDGGLTCSQSVNTIKEGKHNIHNMLLNVSDVISYRYSCGSFSFISPPIKCHHSALQQTLRLGVMSEHTIILLGPHIFDPKLMLSCIVSIHSYVAKFISFSWAPLSHWGQETEGCASIPDKTHDHSVKSDIQ